MMSIVAPVRMERTEKSWIDFQSLPVRWTVWTLRAGDEALAPAPAAEAKVAVFLSLFRQVVQTTLLLKTCAVSSLPMAAPQFSQVSTLKNTTNAPGRFQQKFRRGWSKRPSSRRDQHISSFPF